MPEPIVREVELAETRQLRQAVLRPHQTVAEMAGAEPSDAYAVGAFDGGQLLAVGLIGQEGGARAWRVRGMATAPPARGRGIGTAVLQALLEHAIREGAARIWCHARTPARSLYERSGFAIVSEELTIADIGPHYVMERKLA